MKIEKIFISCYRYDFERAKICIASVRYWYPLVKIFLIKDESQGNFDTSVVEKTWNVSVLQLHRKKFGWGYGKLETLFLEPDFSFLVLDADTVITGPVLDLAEHEDCDFLVDDEVQPETRFNQIYYDLNRIREIDNDFTYPGYSFNTGQWFGTTGKLAREDFDLTLAWTEPPSCKYPHIVFNNDQTHLNFVIHRLEQQKRVKVCRKKIMIWPADGAADFIDINDIKVKKGDYPYIIHWAGMGNNISKLNRNDIIKFYRDFYYSRNGSLSSVVDQIRTSYLGIEKKVLHKLHAK